MARMGYPIQNPKFKIPLNAFSPEVTNQRSSIAVGKIITNPTLVSRREQRHLRPIKISLQLMNPMGVQIA
jgi:hypothetical protein